MTLNISLSSVNQGRRAERVLLHPAGGARGRAGRAGLHPAAVAPRQLLLLARRQVQEPGQHNGRSRRRHVHGRHGRVAVAVLVAVLLGLRRQLLRHGHRLRQQGQEILAG